ncbi:DUF542 domain-containing protein [Corynebacterium pseudodiphtheriticum]|uniref:DUF542 domain-containing protein n=1 Tax=Corynebacterium pseudodiphtheriticum TaxID=37637 RepID=UPI002542C5F7|nr:DUF542 domain-containing protein [Corynebacterium pseudodiphtheriticum]MDK4250238.1 DUF542 domain-containing protein [Corynebacterium pseudodiphtheriticum]MDK4289111.1 DUF542 domain-containing protein [Corynebacterium pseudodiphtheriticum]
MNTLEFRPETTLREIVNTDYGYSQIFEKFRIDFCCNGHRTLHQAAQDAEIPVEHLIGTLQDAQLPTNQQAHADASPADPAAAAGVDKHSDEATQHSNNRVLSAQAHDIVDIHHSYCWLEMPELQELVHKVARVHGDAHPELAKVKEFFDTVVEEMSEHLSREERFVFPAISAMERTGTAATNLDHELRALMSEHDAAGMLMRTIAELTDDFTSPDDACPSYQMMNERLAKFRRDLHLHVHKENNQLFPQALEYSKALG